ncbi:hypothetical protein NQZ79_g1731 [Umbelopsis isabellina]|nr:hypothetical protein NQZ79_g1731 [Umbelopsis isabellina]
MRVSLTACVFALLSVTFVHASPIEDTIENYDLTGIPGVVPHNDTASPGLHPNLHEDAIALHEDSASSSGHTNAMACATMLSMSAAEDLALKAPKLTVEVALNNSEPHLICQT